MDNLELRLEREVRSTKTTIGKLYVNDAFQCFTLEDVDRGLKSSMPLSEIQERKLYGETCIPSGRYEITHSMSGLFNRVMPLVKDVPGFDQIRIHPGNTEADTLGCILVGEGKSKDFVSNSRVAFDKLWPKMKAAWDAGAKVFITINQ